MKAFTYFLLLVCASSLFVACGDASHTADSPSDEVAAANETISSPEEDPAAMTTPATEVSDDLTASTPEMADAQEQEQEAEAQTPSQTAPATDSKSDNPEGTGEAAPERIPRENLKTDGASDPKDPKSANNADKEPDHSPLDHSGWTTLLKKHVTSSGKVSYKGFKADRTALDAYLSELQAHPPHSTWNRNQKLAYWINVYNAFTVDLVVRHYPVKSITDIGSPWDIRFVEIDGKTYTLSEIENKVIRPRFNEPRIHFAVNCASVSCPKLLNEAYTAGKLNSQLTRQTRAYINDPAENILSSKSGEISQIFEWYQEDFVKQGTLIEFINSYADTQLKDNAKISYKPYNWGLNE